MRQSLADTGAGQRGGAVPIFDDRVGGDLWLRRVRRCAVGGDDRRRRHHHRRRALHLSARAEVGARGRDGQSAGVIGSVTNAERFFLLPLWEKVARTFASRSHPLPQGERGRKGRGDDLLFAGTRSERNEPTALSSSNCSSSSATTRRCATGGSNRQGSTIPAPRSDAA